MRFTFFFNILRLVFSKNRRITFYIKNKNLSINLASELEISWNVTYQTITQVLNRVRYEYLILSLPLANMSGFISIVEFLKVTPLTMVHSLAKWRFKRLLTDKMFWYLMYRVSKSFFGIKTCLIIVDLLILDFEEIIIKAVTFVYRGIKFVRIFYLHMIS